MPTYIRNGMDFTGKAWDDFYNMVGSVDFKGREEEAIYKVLKNNFSKTDFPQYLKRYIYQKIRPGKSFDQVPDEEYRDTLIALFRDNCTPPSFDGGSTKLTAAVKNWLSRPHVSRKTVLLLGFGMAMTTAEVNEFLTKGICEQKLNPKDPFEVICRYCYTNRLGYYDFEELRAEYAALEPSEHRSAKDGDSTGELYSSVQELDNKKDLMRYLSGLKEACGASKYSRTLKRKFTELYDQARSTIAEAQGHSDIEKITAIEVESTIFAGVPRHEESFNLYSEAESSLSDLLYGKRLSRARIGKILGKSEGNLQETEVNRFDLITLNFFIFAQKADEYPSIQSRFNSFYEETNKMLSECFMYDMIIQNPYENFILSCMLAEYPLDAFENVWEKSYVEE